LCNPYFYVEFLRENCERFTLRELFFLRMHHFHIFQYFLIMTGISLTNLMQIKIN